MKSEERNALAELANALVAVGIKATDERDAIMISQAQRIIAELAKCQSCSHAVSGVSELLDNCRAIAEEGVQCSCE